jgi:gliding motility-associated-like protein
MINTYLNCDYALAHFDSIVNHISPEMPQQIARWGGSIGEWQGHLDYMRNQIVQRCEHIEEEGILDCYPVTGPFNLAFNVNPAGAGTIRFNELQIPEYPWSGVYYGGVEGEIEATANASYEFDYWEVFNSTLNSIETDELNSFQIIGADSIVAHFKIIETHEITFMVDPANGGTISINGVTPASFPYTATFNEGAPITLTASAAVNYEFVEYSALYHSFAPDEFSITVFLEADTSDTLIAHFVPLQTWDITFIVEPENAGKISVNGNWLQSYPTTITYFPGETINTDIFAEEEYEFSHYIMLNHDLLFDSTMLANGCIVDTTDTLTAYFNLKEVIPQTMYVPSSFTPNGDDLNDFFQCYHTETVVDGSVVIFDRWGQEVFSHPKLDFKWDGTRNNMILPEGVYYYMLTYYLSDKYFEVAQGKIVLIR